MAVSLSWARALGQVHLVPRARAVGGLGCPGEGHCYSQQSWQVNVLV